MCIRVIFAYYRLQIKLIKTMLNKKSLLRGYIMFPNIIGIQKINKLNYEDGSLVKVQITLAYLYTNIKVLRKSPHSLQKLAILL
jgi:hypothetical protein